MKSGVALRPSVAPPFKVQIGPFCSLLKAPAFSVKKTGAHCSAWQPFNITSVDLLQALPINHQNVCAMFCLPDLKEQLTIAII